MTTDARPSVYSWSFLASIFDGEKTIESFQSSGVYAADEDELRRKLTAYARSNYGFGASATLREIKQGRKV